MSKWIGFAVSVNCGEPLGCYQGTILAADGNTITLTKAFRNGFPYPKSQVTLNAADIKELKIIEEAHSEPSEQTHSTVAVTKNNKKVQRATVCENLQANPSHSSNQQNVQTPNTNKSRGSIPTPARSKPIEIQGARANKTNNNHSGSYGASAGKSRGAGAAGGPAHEKARRRNEACFGNAADPALNDDFDFEGNLALFDKQALWQEMSRPDVVRAADEAARARGRLRHDENVLPAPAPAPATACDIRLPDHLRAPLDYTTDAGRVVPAASEMVRARVWRGLRRWGLAETAAVLLARAAADVALRLAGGGRRLEARNAHQAPVCVAAAGAHLAGAAAALAARLLLAHGARAAALVPPPAARDPHLHRELAALALAGGAVHTAVADLPHPDIVILALHDPEGEEEEEEEGEGEGWRGEALSWARGARAALLLLEPGGGGWGGVRARAALQGGLAGALAPALGQPYLANVAPPPQLLAELGVRYRPPFGASAVLPLHRAPPPPPPPPPPHC